MSFTQFRRSPEEIWNVLPGWGTGDKKAQEVEEAKRILAEAGYPNGISNVKLMTVNFSVTINMGEFFSGELNKIGISSGLDIQDFAVWNPRTRSGDYQAAPMWYSLFTTDPDEGLFNQYVTGGSRNILHYSNPELDALAQQQSVELDPQKRAALVRQIEDILLRDLPYAPAQAPLSDVLMYSYVKGWEWGIGQSTAHLRKERMWMDR